MEPVFTALEKLLMWAQKTDGEIHSVLALSPRDGTLIASLGCRHPMC